jgi:hypothetical protein
MSSGESGDEEDEESDDREIAESSDEEAASSVSSLGLGDDKSSKEDAP